MGIESGLQPNGFDTTRTFVRVVERRPDGFVEFRFSIGDPALFVEMLLTEAAFDEFRTTNHAELLPSLADLPNRAGGEDRDEDDESDWDWSMHDATHQRFR